MSGATKRPRPPVPHPSLPGVKDARCVVTGRDADTFARHAPAKSKPTARRKGTARQRQQPAASGGAVGPSAPGALPPSAAVLDGGSRLVGARGGKPEWRDSAIALWHALVGAHPERRLFAAEEFYECAQVHWDQFCWNFASESAWRASLRRALENAMGRVDGARARLFVTDTTADGARYGLRGEAGVGAPALAVTAAATAAAASASAAAAGTSAAGQKRPAPGPAAAGGEDELSKWKKPRRSHRKATVPAKPPAGAAGVEDAGAGVASARDGQTIPEVWTRVPPGPVRLSSTDKAADLPLSEGADGHPEVRGYKGFRSARATHGVCEGDWYFEVTVLPVSPAGADGAVRAGWTTRRSDVEGPVGHDGAGYGIRDRSGQFVFRSKLESYGKPYGVGDVMGCRIRLPPRVDAAVKAKMAAADAAWLECRFVRFLQNKPPPDSGETLAGAFVEFSKNGQPFGMPEYFWEDRLPGAPTSRGMPAAVYFPTVSLFKGGCARVNFGPEFAHPLPSGSRPYAECAPPPAAAAPECAPRPPPLSSPPVSPPSQPLPPPPPVPPSAATVPVPAGAAAKRTAPRPAPEAEQLPGHTTPSPLASGLEESRP